MEFLTVFSSSKINKNIEWQDFLSFAFEALLTLLQRKAGNFKSIAMFSIFLINYMWIGRFIKYFIFCRSSILEIYKKESINKLSITYETIQAQTINVWSKKSYQILTQLFYGIVTDTNKNKCVRQYLPSKKNVTISEIYT